MAGVVGFLVMGAAVGQVPPVRGAAAEGADEGWRRVPEALPVVHELERQRVVFLRVQDWCQAYDDGDGVHANTLQGTCTLTGGGRLFDAGTRARYEALEALTRRLPYRVHYVQLSYDAAGRLTTAYLALDAGMSREALVYEPGHPHPVGERRSDGAESVARGVDADWYHLTEDWM